MNDGQKQQFITLFQNQNISESDNNFWFSRLETMTEEMQTHVLALFQEFPQEIMWLRGIQERKDHALALRNHEEWKSILKEEEDHFDRLSAGKD